MTAIGIFCLVCVSQPYNFEAAFALVRPIFYSVLVAT